MLKITAILLLTIAPALAQSGFQLTKLDCKDEKTCKKYTDKHVTQKNNVMTFKFENGKSHKFISNPKACDRDDTDNCLRHYIFAVAKTQSYYVVGAYFWEWEFYYLVNPRHNQVIKMNAEPIFAPNGKHILAVSCNHPYNDEELSIYSEKNGKFVNTLEYNNEMREGHKYCYNLKNWSKTDIIDLKDFKYEGVKEAPFKSIHWKNNQWVFQ